MLYFFALTCGWSLMDKKQVSLLKNWSKLTNSWNILFFQKHSLAHFWNWRIDYTNFKLEMSISTKKLETLSNFILESIIKTKEINSKIFFFKERESSHEIPPFLDIFPSQPSCSSLSFNHRIIKTDLESLRKTVFRMYYFQ